MRYILFVVTAMLSLCGPVHAVDPATGIDWEVKNRFRVVREHRHDAFMADFNSYFQRAAGRRGLDIPSGSLMRYPSPFRQNLPTHYLPEAAQYRHSWFHGDERDIIVRLLSGRTPGSAAPGASMAAARNPRHAPNLPPCPSRSARANSP